VLLVEQTDEVLEKMLNEVRRRRRGKTGDPLGCSGIRRSREKGKESEHTREGNRELWEVVDVLIVFCRLKDDGEKLSIYTQFNPETSQPRISSIQWPVLNRSARRFNRRC
jgi:hypothetical protein